MKTCKITIMCFVLLVLSLKARLVDMRLTYDDFQKQSDYILLLKKDSNGNFVPLTGHQDAGFSFKVVYGLFNWQYRLPQDFSVLQPRDADGNPILRKGEPNWGHPRASPPKVDPSAFKEKK